MRSAQVPYSGVRSPRGWLFLAFLGVWLYLVSQLLRIYPERVADAFVLTVLDVKEVLAIISGLGQILFFAGLVAALWRANLAAGLSGSGVRGLVFGAAGVGILTLFEAALFLDWVGVSLSPANALIQTPALDAGVIAGTALAFAGLASLVFGLAQATDLFGRTAPEVPEAASRPEETS